MATSGESTETKSSGFLTKLLAVVVLIVAAVFLAKIVIHILAGLMTAIVVVVALVAIVWAVRVL